MTDFEIYCGKEDACPGYTQNVVHLPRTKNENFRTKILSVPFQTRTQKLETANEVLGQLIKTDTTHGKVLSEEP